MTSLKALSMPNKSEWYTDGLKFSCTQCGNCCTGPPGYVWLTPKEAQDIAGYLKIDTEKVYAQYTHTIDGRRSLNEYKTPYGYDCVFLTRTPEGKAQCRIYPVRPAQCRTWPFWPENLGKPADWRRASKTCPGIDHGRLYPIEHIRITRNHPTTAHSANPTPDHDAPR